MGSERKSPPTGSPRPEDAEIVATAAATPAERRDERVATVLGLRGAGWTRDEIVKRVAREFDVSFSAAKDSYRDAMAWVRGLRELDDADLRRDALVSFAQRVARTMRRQLESIDLSGASAEDQAALLDSGAKLGLSLERVLRFIGEAEGAMAPRGTAVKLAQQEADGTRREITVTWQGEEVPSPLLPEGRDGQ